MVYKALLLPQETVIKVITAEEDLHFRPLWLIKTHRVYQLHCMDLAHQAIIAQQEQLPLFNVLRVHSIHWQINIKFHNVFHVLQAHIAHLLVYPQFKVYAELVISV